MPIDTRYQRALSLAREGKLEEAQNLLLTLDSPEAEKLLDRVNKAIAARGSKPQEAPKLKNQEAVSQAVAAGIKQAKDAEKQEKAKQGKGARNRVIAIISVITLVLAVLAGVVAFFLNQSSPYMNVLGVCTGVIVSGGDCDTEVILTEYPNAEANCKARLGNWTKQTEYDWWTCLVDEGVVFEARQ